MTPFAIGGFVPAISLDAGDEVGKRQITPAEDLSEGLDGVLLSDFQGIGFPELGESVGWPRLPFGATRVGHFELDDFGARARSLTV